MLDHNDFERVYVASLTPGDLVVGVAWNKHRARFDFRDDMVLLSVNEHASLDMEDEDNPEVALALVVQSLHATDRQLGTNLWAFCVVVAGAYGQPMSDTYHMRMTEKVYRLKRTTQTVNKQTKNVVPVRKLERA